jgi:hypothetical protein
MDAYDNDHLTVAAPEGYISGLTPCYHKDRFVVLVEACTSADCRRSIASDDIFEFTFEHPSGKRAVECLGKPKLGFVAAGRVAAAVVGGGISASLGSSVGGSMSGSTAGSAGGAMALIGTVQFIALLTDNCGTQADSALLDFLTLLTPLQIFNLRIVMPDLLLFKPLTEWRIVVDINFCGMGGVEVLDLVAQARANEGEMFVANVAIGLMVVGTVAFLHVLLLLPPLPRYRQIMHRSAPFGKWETILLLTGFTGLLVSSFRMIAMDGPVCKYAGLVVLVIPTFALLFVTCMLVLYVRPSSSKRLVRWDKDQGDWVSRKTARYSRDSVFKQLERIATSELPTHASRPDARAPTLVRLPTRLKQTLLDSLAADFLDRYAHFFVAYLNVRGAWLALPLVLVQQYVMAAFLGLGVASGGCLYEQVSTLSSSL